MTFDTRADVAAPGRIRRLLADKGYDADWLRADLRKVGIGPAIPGTRSRKRPIRYDKLERNYASAIALAAVIAFWYSLSPDPRTSY